MDEDQRPFTLEVKMQRLLANGSHHFHGERVIDVFILKRNGKRAFFSEEVDPVNLDAIGYLDALLPVFG